MAFLLSPKSDAGVTYALAANFNISVNGAPAQTYSDDNPGAVHPGDVITSQDAGGGPTYKYFANEGTTLVTSGTFTMPYTVEAVAGADMLRLIRGIS